MVVSLKNLCKVSYDRHRILVQERLIQSMDYLSLQCVNIDWPFSSCQSGNSLHHAFESQRHGSMWTTCLPLAQDEGLHLVPPVRHPAAPCPAEA